ncbi:8052_t:CDS:1, partial [Gigaspora margarita]
MNLGEEIVLALSLFRSSEPYPVQTSGYFSPSVTDSRSILVSDGASKFPMSSEFISSSLPINDNVSSSN